jgi:hypothetical protein
MANFIVRNSLNPYKVIKIGVTFSYVVPKNNEGDPLWVIELATEEKDITGNTILPEYITVVNLDNIDEEIEKATAIISDKVDWGTPLDDSRAPLVDSHLPEADDNSVSLFQDVIINLLDIFPSEGIDIGSINLTINDVNVTSDLDITGNPYDYKVTWKPPVRVMDTYL